MLNVPDLASERRFYESLGLPVIYAGLREVDGAHPGCVTPL